MSESGSQDGRPLAPKDTPVLEEKKDAASPSDMASSNATNLYPSPQKRVIIMLSVFLTIFLVTLDQNIMSTATPRITDEFHSIADIGWYGTSYLLTMSSFMLLMGKVYKFYPAKPVFLGGIGMFELGSAICGAAPSSNALIVGRAFAGLGASGMFSGAMIIMFHTLPLEERPIYQGFFGAVFALASVVGPLAGGLFTDKVSWRWCFYINLPLGALVVVAIYFILHLPNAKVDKRAEGWMGKFKQLDPIGNLVFFPGVVCLILALQWGGTTYAWKDARIIVLFVLFGILCLAFIGIQIWRQEEGTIPPRIVKKRSIAASAWFAFFNGAGLYVILFYLPLWFQGIKGVSAVKSGIMLLPLIISSVCASISSGFLVSKVGYCTPFFILSTIITTVGAGLITTFTPTTNHSKWIGYQVVLGLGVGFGAQQPLVVVQTVLDRSDISTATAFIMFIRFIGSAIFVPVAQNIFINALVSKLTNLPGIKPSSITNGGATQLRRLASGDDLKTLLSDYNTAIVYVFYLVASTSAMSIFGSVLVEWRSLKARAQEQAKGTGEQKAASETKVGTVTEESV